MLNPRVRIIAVIIIFAIAFLVAAPVFSFASSPIEIIIDGEKKDFGINPVLIDGTTLLPMRAIFESLGASVKWDPDNQQITAAKGSTTIVLTIGNSTAFVNSQPRQLDKAARIINKSTFVPVRFVSEALGEKVRWDGAGRRVIIGEEFTLSNSLKMPLDGRTFNVNVVEVNLSSDKIGLKTALAKNKFGEVEALKSIADGHNAIAAINGTFFSAYTDIKEPYGNLIVDGTMVHMGNFGTTVAFDANNNVKIDRIDVKIEGGTNSSYHYPNNWYAYWFNRTPTPEGNSVVIYTPARGSALGFNYGTSVVVDKGIVKEIKTGNVNIPTEGFVVNFLGSEKYLLNRFKVGSPAAYGIKISPAKTEKVFWDNIKGAVGAGPTLVVNGIASTNPEGEGFFENKILTNAGARSAIGVTRDNRLLLVTVNSATIRELAQIMKQLGAHNAMNLDGGASSCLYYQGKYLTSPGREISNAIIVYRK